MNQARQKDNFLYLLIALVGLLFLITLMDYFIEKIWLSHVINYVILFSILVSVLGVKKQKLEFRIGLSISLLLFGIDLIQAFNPQPLFNALQLYISLFFFIFVAWHAAKQVLFSGTVNANIIIGSICIYLLMGLIWGMFYLLLLKIEPNAFNGIEGTISWQHNLPNTVYFSFVSLASLGYGEITPVFPPARFLAYIEAITGQFYMAILVASLIGARMSKKDIT